MIPKFMIGHIDPLRQTLTEFAFFYPRNAFQVRHLLEALLAFRQN
jgi:hypothetical protein